MRLTRNEWLFLILAAVLLAVYALYFTDWFKPKVVRVTHAVRTGVRLGRHGHGHGHGADAGADTGALLGFGLDETLKLTEVRVVSLAEWQTNARAVPLWHLISDSNSVPVRAFYYGQNIRGMRPFVAGIPPRPLETNQTYRLLIEAGKITGQHDFQLGVVALPVAR
jgi:hypothetical protein